MAVSSPLLGTSMILLISPWPGNLYEDTYPNQVTFAHSQKGIQFSQEAGGDTIRPRSGSGLEVSEGKTS